MEPPLRVLAHACPELTCGKAFETKEQFDEHRKDAHPVIEDFMKFALDAANKALGFNDDGTRMPGFGPRVEKKNAVKANFVASNKASFRPGMKQAAVTPAGAQQMARTGTRTGKPGVAGNVSSPQSAEDKDKAGIAVKRVEENDDAWRGCTVTSKELVEIFEQFDSMSARGWEAVGSPADGTHTPATTPSPATSKDTAETQDSDPIADLVELDAVRLPEESTFPTQGFEVFDDLHGLLDEPMVGKENEAYDWLDWEGKFGPECYGFQSNKVPGW